MHNIYTQGLGISRGQAVQNRLVQLQILPGFPPALAKTIEAWVQSLHKIVSFTGFHSLVFHRENARFQSVRRVVMPAIHRPYNNNNYSYIRINKAG